MHCHPLHSPQQAKPSLDDRKFVQDMYRLKGFAYLRSSDQPDALLKSVKAFEKASSMPQPDKPSESSVPLPQVVEREEEFVDEVRQLRVTFINYRTRIVNELLQLEAPASERSEHSQ